MGDTSRTAQVRAIALSVLIVTSMIAAVAMPVSAATNELWTHTEHATDQKVNDVVYDSETGILYSASNDNTVIAYDTEAKSVVWQHTHHSDVVYELALKNGVVYSAGADGAVVAADASDGSQIWSHTHHGTLRVNALAVSDSGEVISGEQDGSTTDSTIIAADPSDGSQLWSHDLHSDGIWALDTDNGTLYSASSDNTVIAYDMSSHSQVWSHAKHSDRPWTLKAVDGVVYSGGLDSTVIAFDAETESVLWSHTHHGTEYISALEVVDNAVFSTDTSSTGEIIGADIDTGDKVYNESFGDWAYGIGVSVDRVFVGGLPNTVTAYEHTFGSKPITGTITDREGDTVPNATVSVYDDSTGDLAVETVTDGSGAYSVEPAQGDYWIEATKNGVSATSDTFSYDPTVGATEDVSLDLLYYGSGSLEIVDRSDGTLLDDREVTVEFVGTSAFASSSTTITSDGSVTYDHLTSSTHEVRLSADGFADRTFVVGDTKDNHYVGLLPSDAERIETTIAIDDRTGHFDPADSWVEVQRYDSTNGWTTEDGAHLGSDNRGTVQWQPGETYRVYVRNMAGQSVVLGEHTPTAADSDEVLTFPISEYSETEGTTGGFSDPNNWNRNPIGDFTVSPNDPIVDETISLDASSSRDLDGSISSYEWVVDGTSYSGETVSITAPSESGSVPITLTVEDDQGATNTVSTSIYVAASSSERSAPPTPAFTFSPDEPAPGEPIRLDASGSSDDGSIEAFRWDLNGDGEVDAEGESVEFTYQDGGIHKATLIVEDELGATNRISETIPVYDEPPEGSGGFGGAIGAGAVTTSPAGPTDPGVRFGLGAIVLGGLAVLRRSNRIQVSDRVLGAVGAVDLLVMGHAAMSDPFAAGAISAVAGIGFVVQRRFLS